MNFEPYIFAAIGYFLGPSLIYAMIYVVAKLCDWQRSRKYELRLTYDPPVGFINLMKWSGGK